MGAASEHTAEVEGHMVFWREAEGDAWRAPVLYVHGVPDSSEIWAEFMASSGGVALDLPGFGRSGKRADFDYSIPGYARFLEAFLDHLELERVRLVVHDWGAVGLALAARAPERIERLVAISPVPFVAGFRWHRAARLWRTRGIGEMTMGLQTASVFRRAARGMPREQADRALAYMDHGTQRAILRLYRSADPDVLDTNGQRLSNVGAPALIVWGADDAFLPVRHAESLAKRLPDAEVEIVSDSGHWAWTERPDVRTRTLRFLEA